MKRFVEGGAAENIPIVLEIAEGSTATEILAKAEAMPADLLVMGTHGRSGFERLVLGSVTERVLRKAACPMLTVPEGVAAAVPVPPVPFTRIVCAVDFSDCSLHALNYAMSLAQEADARLTVVHVIELPPEVPREAHETVPAGPRDLQGYIALVEEDSRARLKDAVPDSVRATAPSTRSWRKASPIARSCGSPRNTMPTLWWSAFTGAGLSIDSCSGRRPSIWSARRRAPCSRCGKGSEPAVAERETYICPRCLGC